MRSGALSRSDRSALGIKGAAKQAKCADEIAPGKVNGVPPSLRPF